MQYEENMSSPTNDGFLFSNIRSSPKDSQSFIGSPDEDVKKTSSISSFMEQFSNKNFLIIILTILLVFSFLGINLLAVFGNIFQTIVNLLKPLVVYILSFFGYTAGTVLTKTADIVGDTVITGVDIAQETVKSAGEVLKNASRTPELDRAINKGSSDYAINEPEPAKTSNPVVATGSKKSWCLVGEHMEKRGCIEIDQYDKCMSGQVYPSQKMCLNPTMTP
jgi:hypothetical protein